MHEQSRKRTAKPKPHARGLMLSMQRSKRGLPNQAIDTWGVRRTVVDVATPKRNYDLLAKVMNGSSVLQRLVSLVDLRRGAF